MCDKELSVKEEDNSFFKDLVTVLVACVTATSSVVLAAVATIYVIENII